MKLKLLFIFLFFSVLFSNAQTTTAKKTSVLDKDCPPPTINDYKAICAHIATRAKDNQNNYYFTDYAYEKKLLQMSCADLDLDSEEIVKKKLQFFWNKYKTKCKCDSLDFILSNGNILKYALSQKMPEVIENLADTYGLNINFIDPADGLNLLDWINKEMKSPNNTKDNIKYWEEVRTRVIDVGGKPSK